MICGGMCREIQNCTPVLKYDTALLRLFPQEPTEELIFMAQSQECYKCPLVPICTVRSGSPIHFVVNTSFPTRFAITSFNGSENICSGTYHFGERGHYDFNISVTGQTCNITETSPSINSYLPILYAFLIYLGLGLLWLLLAFGRRKWSERTPVAYLLDEEESPGSPQVKKARKNQRLRSLDTFRGLAIIIMIFVNYGGGGYWFFAHSAWNGLTIADLVFAWFMFIMGTSMAFSLDSSLRRCPDRWKLWLQILRRSVVLFGLGIFLNSQLSPGSDVRFLRIFGVLQRFGISYFVVASLRCLSMVDITAMQNAKLPWLKDITFFWVEWCIMLAGILLHISLTFWLPVPNCPKGYLGPGGLDHDLQYSSCTGGAAGYIDRLILGDKHVYNNPTSRWLYNNDKPFDPEGILGSVTSCIVVFLGLQSGQILLCYKNWCSRLKRFLIWALVLGLVAGILCKFSQHDGWIPVNKNLWSLSYCLCLSSMAFLLLSLFYLIIDVCKIWNGSPLFQAGMNALLLYLGHELFGRGLPFSWAPLPDTHGAHLAQDLWGATLWVAIAVLLNRKRLYFTV